MSDPSPTPSKFAPPRPEAVADLVGLYGRWPFVERRSGADRRSKPTRMLSKWNFWGTRARGRRRGEDRNIYVDRYEASDLVVVSVILILNVLDAWLTLVYLGYGGVEANPIAKALLDAGTGSFVGAKSVAVGGCLLFLVLHKKFMAVRPALRVLMGFYGVLLVYHLYLQAAALISGNIV